ncbi:MAG: Wzz/FepE/Etk N-terminal domain-containing protein [Sporomusaceae bacterium]|nr:Wzz/FepE/Etk N-terminal domain-containing protein [Sporomusaceae bacterium]
MKTEECQQKKTSQGAYNLLSVVRQAKWLILIITFICLAGSLAYIQTRKPVYVSEAAFQFCEYNDTGVGRQLTLGNPEAVLVDLTNKFGPKTQQSPYLVVQMEKSTLKMRAYGTDPAETKKFLEGIVSRTEQDNAKHYNAMVRKQDELMASLKSQRQSIVDALTNLNSKAGDGLYDGISVPLLMRLQYDLDQRIYLTEFNVVKPPLIVQPPTLLQGSQAGRLYFIVLSILVGFGGGITLVLARNYFRNLSGHRQA